MAFTRLHYDPVELTIDPCLLETPARASGLKEHSTDSPLSATPPLAYVWPSDSDYGEPTIDPALLQQQVPGEYEALDEYAGLAPDPVFLQQPPVEKPAVTFYDAAANDIANDQILPSGPNYQPQGTSAPPAQVETVLEQDPQDALFATLEQKITILLEKTRATRARVAFARQVGRRTTMALNPRRAQQLTDYLMQRASAINAAAADLDARLDRVIAEANQ